MNTWYIVAQILGIITITLEIVTYQLKDKTRFFMVSTLSSFFWFLMFIAIGLATSLDTQLSVMLAGLYSTIRNGLFWWMHKKDTPAAKERALRTILVLVFFVLIAGTFTILSAPSQVRWLHILGLIAAILFAISQYLPGVHYVRGGVLMTAILVGLTQTPINILEGDFRWNIMGIAIETAKIVSVIVFYVKYAKEENKAHLKFAKP